MLCAHCFLPTSCYKAPLLSTVPRSLTAALVALLMATLGALLATVLAAALAAALAAKLCPAVLAALLVALLVAREPNPHMLDCPLRSVRVSVSFLNSPRASRIRAKPPVRPSVMRCIQPSAEARSPARELQRPPGPTSPSAPPPPLLLLLRRP